MKANKLIRVLHRDLGYIAFGLTFIYCVSGIALNHRNSWNPTTKVINTLEINVPSINKDSINDAYIVSLTSKHNIDKFNKYFIRNSNLIVNFKNGRLELNTENGKGKIYYTQKRFMFNETINLHRTSKSLWIWYSDFYAISLLLLAVTGLIMVKGKKGFKKRGVYLVIAGLLFPAIVLILYFI